ncbi:hypothetical protein FHW23_002057 [Curtobacterium pusillum]|uniref:Uncharacterized protein n=1 Tax=Curtobacterium pusillum TaxID=69373 RepID=A0AAW3T8R3_9MICO|nr:hypothetical protein [Curtobacterium pusillum]MBA8990792.1 hypothetical protein [Curtobacterium pusillum]
MRPRLRHQAPAIVLAVLAAGAGLVALLADHLSWPMAPAFPWHEGDFGYVATKREWELAHAAGTIAWGSAALAVLLIVASVVAALARRRSD